MPEERAAAGQFCPNEDCERYGDAEEADIIRFGTTARGTQRYCCQVCGKTFVETTGTMFYDKRASKKEILEALAMFASGTRLSRISRVIGYKEDTILAWMRDAAEQAEEVAGILMSDYGLSHAQIDRIWAYVRRSTTRGANLKGFRRKNAGDAR